MVESGRYNKKRQNREDRLCKICTSGKVENEFHFMFECSTYDVERRNILMM